MPRNHWWFTFSSGGLFEGSRLYNPSGSREVVPGEVIQGGPDHPLLLFQEFPQGGSRPCSACESPGRLQGGVKSRRSQAPAPAPAPAPAWKGMPGMGLCPGKSWKVVWDQDWIRLPCPVTCQLAPMEDGARMPGRAHAYVCPDVSSGKGSRQRTW